MEFLKLDESADRLCIQLFLHLNLDERRRVHHEDEGLQISLVRDLRFDAMSVQLLAMNVCRRATAKRRQIDEIGPVHQGFGFALHPKENETASHCGRIRAR